MKDRGGWSEVRRNYPSGKILFEENDPASRMYVIRRGRIRIYRRVGKDEVELATLGAGDFFGEMALLEGLPRSANAQVVEDCELIEVDASTFEAMIRGSSEIAVRIMRALAARVRELDFRLQNLLAESGVGRAIEILRWLLPKGTREGDFVRLDASRVHVAITAQARLPLYEVQDVLDRLRRAGCIREEGKDILIAKSERLDQYATYLDLKRRYQPNDRIPTEALAVSPDDKKKAVQRLLKALGGPQDSEEGESALRAQYRKYVDLQRRFERK
jgi:CRP/FNR family cyclic AMP-dependent transcriptional regulator